MNSARLRVDLEALARNYQRLVEAAPATGAVVKADAYGCGAGPVARRLFQAGCRDFFVANAMEGRALRAVLRQHSPAPRIFVFEGVRGETLPLILEADLIPVLNHRAQVACWRPHQARPAALHIDTGMARLGFDVEDLDEASLDGLNLVLLLTHYACADEPEAALNVLQADRFRARCESLAAQFPAAQLSMGNSAATLSDGVTTRGLARAGIALYGGRAFAGDAALPPLEPVAQLEGQVLQLRSLAAGASAGYGATWVAKRPSRLAVVGLGYADGVRRSLSNLGCVGFKGQLLPLVGRVSMDLVQVDLTELPAGAAPAEGDWLTFFGSEPRLSMVADQLHTIDYEVLTAVGPRVTRRYERWRAV